MKNMRIISVAIAAVLAALTIALYISMQHDGSNYMENSTTTPPPKASPIISASPTPAITPSAIAVSAWTMQRDNPEETGNYRDAMRWWVIDIAQKARKTDEDFIIIPQNCTGLFPPLGNTDMNLSNLFMNTISAVGNESLVYGLNGYGSANAERQIASKSEALQPALSLGKQVLSIDYCKKENAVTQSMSINKQMGFVDFQAEKLELTTIPKSINAENSRNIYTIDDADNFLILLNPGEFSSRNHYIDALSATNYDVLIIDCYYDEGAPLSVDEVNRLKQKANGGKRLVISYLSIGEAEDYRPYWQEEYHDNYPEWILNENPDWVGNYPVYYWNEQWQDIIAFGENSYLSIIQNAGFDGIYMDIVDGYENFE